MVLYSIADGKIPLIIDGWAPTLRIVGLWEIQLHFLDGRSEGMLRTEQRSRYNKKNNKPGTALLGGGRSWRRYDSVGIEPPDSSALASTQDT